MKKLCLLLLLTSVLEAEQEGMLNRLLAPGPLIKGHQELESKDCLKCHEVGKGISEEKCLSCHKPIEAEVRSHSGFHGLTKESCIHCHSDHKGRDNDTTTLDQKSFDHSTTGFKLEGKHEKLKCSECHTEKLSDKSLHPGRIRYIGAKTSCSACHKKDDVHHFTGKFAKVDCNQCHGLKTWHDGIKFDHKRDGHYALEGKHASIKCSECHKDGVYKWPNLEKSQCLSCHKDYHANNLSPKFQGGKCNKCHGFSAWKIEEFNHAAVGSPLRGKHKEIECFECHKQREKPTSKKMIHWTGLKTDCLSCHKNYHRFGKFRSPKLGELNQCLNCHTETKWDDVHDFNHSVQTRYPIDGKHIKLDCNKCHIPNEKANPRAEGIYHWGRLDKDTCEVCHKSPHKNDPSPTFKNKKCDQCHVTEGWNIFEKNGKRFNHDNTRFKLTGRHSEIACSACHVVGKKEVFHFDHFDQKFCVDCHKNPHINQFHEKFSSQSCAECHNTTKFSERLEFNHAGTAFPLNGKHREVKCEACHKKTEEMFEGKSPHPKSQFIFPNLAKESCFSCHEDYHRGQLGTKCEACHNDSGWKNVTFDHNKQSRFAIRGKHVGVKCSECHKVVPNEPVTFKNETHALIRFKPISPDCTTCHKDPHHGHYGNQCQECHMDKGWKITKDFHRNFTLAGVHYTLQCQECHRDNRKLAGQSASCVVCHQKDDIHEGTLPQCGQCHRQQFWEDVDFKHSLTQFPLRGAHRTLECAECHARGIYQGTPSQCINCHLADAQKSSTHPQPIPSFTNCKDCHNQFVW